MVVNAWGLLYCQPRLDGLFYQSHLRTADTLGPGQLRPRIIEIRGLKTLSIHTGWIGCVVLRVLPWTARSAGISAELAYIVNVINR